MARGTVTEDFDGGTCLERFQDQEFCISEGNEECTRGFLSSFALSLSSADASLRRKSSVRRSEILRARITKQNTQLANQLPLWKGLDCERNTGMGPGHRREIPEASEIARRSQ